MKKSKVKDKKGSRETKQGCGPASRRAVKTRIMPGAIEPKPSGTRSKASKKRSCE
jgi:hypothetical protein